MTFGATFEYNKISTENKTVGSGTIETAIIQPVTTINSADEDKMRNT
jgi:hypothetical protein